MNVGGYNSYLKRYLQCSPKVTSTAAPLRWFALMTTTVMLQCLHAYSSPSPRVSTGNGPTWSPHWVPHTPPHPWSPITHLFFEDLQRSGWNREGGQATPLLGQMAHSHKKLSCSEWKITLAKICFLFLTKC